MYLKYFTQYSNRRTIRSVQSMFALLLAMPFAVLADPTATPAPPTVDPEYANPPGVGTILATCFISMGVIIGTVSYLCFKKQPDDERFDNPDLHFMNSYDRQTSQLMNTSQVSID